MEIKVEQTLNSWIIWVNGKAHDTVSFSEKYGFSRTTLTKRLSGVKDNVRYIEDILWKYNNNVPFTDVIFINDAGERCATAIVERQVPGLEKAYIRKRLSSWRSGEIDGDGLFQPPEMGKCGGSNSPGPSSVSITHTEGSAVRHEASKRMLANMPPRKEPEDIKPPGIWERENMSATGRPTRCQSSSTHGTYLFGD